ncbi:MAG: phosphotransacetylase family protein [Halobacteriales archaeon]
MTDDDTQTPTESETNTILITATEEGSGKTAIAIALALLARERGADAGYMKPKGTRLESHTGKTLDADPMLATELLGLEADLATLEPVVYSPTFVEGAIRRRDDPEELHETVRENFATLAEGRDVMIVEGGGRLTTGGVVDLTDPEVADLLDARVVLVAGYEKPGDVDEVLGAAATIGDRLAGVIFNRVDDAAYDALAGDVVPFLEGRGIPVLGTIPSVADLAGVSVADLASELGAERLTDHPAEGVVGRFLVGAMGPDEALRQFRRANDAAVVTGGDRSEIHTAALEAPGVRCLVLTGGLRPPPAVLGKAEDRGVPVLLVQSETLATVERLEDVISGGRTRDEETVTRMRELLFEHANVEDILGIEATYGNE